MIAKQMDIRSNIKKYFDIAFDGEPIHVPRIGNKNVVIISEKEFNRLSQSKRVLSYAELLNSAARSNISADNSTHSLKEVNLEKLNIISRFKDGWDGNEASAFNNAIIVKVRSLIETLVVQPEVFPTAMETIQLEFDNSAKEHMEIEVGIADEIEIIVVQRGGKEKEERLVFDIEKICSRVLDFYG